MTCRAVGPSIATRTSPQHTTRPPPGVRWMTLITAPTRRPSRANDLRKLGSAGAANRALSCSPRLCRVLVTGAGTVLVTVAMLAGKVRHT